MISGYIAIVKTVKRELHRYNALANALDITINKLSTETGIPVTTIRKAIDRGSDITTENANKIVTRYPKVNLNWLVSGKGNIFKSTNESAVGEVEVEYNVKKGVGDFINNAITKGSEVFKTLDISPDDLILLGNIKKLLEERKKKK